MTPQYLEELKQRFKARTYYCKTTENGCILWYRGKNFGYGVFRDVKNGKSIYAHRASYIIHTKTEIPDGMDVLHKCNNKACINPEHLYLGTDKENAKDRRAADTCPIGERSGRSKLTDEQVREIKKILKLNIWGNKTRLAHKYHVSNQMICDIEKGKNWKHIE